MHKVLIVGAGKIGSLISVLLATAEDYEVYVADIFLENEFLQKIIAKIPNIKLVHLDAQNPVMMADYLKKNPVNSIISSLPYYCNTPIAKLAHDFNVNYFDLTEDVEVAKTVAKLANGNKSVFVPQCGLAPGFISIVANHLMRNFPELDTVKMRVGALPINISNGLQYTLTWSTDGLINEYGNLCHAIEKGEEVQLFPLGDLEEIKVDGLTYEAFNTSGGVGTLAQTYKGKIQNLNYKTIRYPGHCTKVNFLMNDLRLNYDRDTLKRILENSIPKTFQDVVLVYVSVTGKQDKQYTEENYFKKFYPKNLHGFTWSAIQMTTASAICSVVDIVNKNPEKYHGLVKQEQFSLDEFVNNRFGQYYQ